MPRLGGSLRRWLPALGSLLLAAALLAGCGGSGGNATSESSGATTSEAGSPVARAPVRAPSADDSSPGRPDRAGAKAKRSTGSKSHRRNARRPASKGEAEAGPRGAKRHPEPAEPRHEEAGRPPRSSPTPAPTTVADVSPAEKHELRKHCPKGTDLESCKQLVEGFAATPKEESHSYTDPGQCEAVMSREQCEATLPQQAAAAESDGSVNVDECLANMTPHCEEVLRPIFETQNEARRQTGE